MGIDVRHKIGVLLETDIEENVPLSVLDEITKIGAVGTEATLTCNTPDSGTGPETAISGSVEEFTKDASTDVTLVLAKVKAPETLIVVLAVTVRLVDTVCNPLAVHVPFSQVQEAKLSQVAIRANQSTRLSWFEAVFFLGKKKSQNKAPQRVITCVKARRINFHVLNKVETPWCQGKRDIDCCRESKGTVAKVGAQDLHWRLPLQSSVENDAVIEGVGDNDKPVWRHRQIPRCVET